MRRPFMLVASVVATVVVLATTATPAHASVWQYTDGFEPRPASGGYWYDDGVGDHHAIVSGLGPARTGTSAGVLWQWDAGWSSLGRTVLLSPRQVHPDARCSAAIWVLPETGSATLNLEIINPATWTYVALRTVTVSGSGWQQHAVGPWTGGPTSVFVRFALVSNGPVEQVRLDDLVVNCSY